MSTKLEACDECSLMCHAMHRRKGDTSCIATSFFKIMFGFNYNDFLLLPPIFARRVQHLNGHEVQLEDSSGEQWTVTVSEVEDSLAFEDGWNAFSKDHRLKVGEILVFHLIRLSNPVHFFVQIYGASGCPVFKVKDDVNSNKRSRTEGDFGVKDGPSRVNENELDSAFYFDNGIQSIQDVPKTRQFAEPFRMIERKDGNLNSRSGTEGDFGAKDGPSRVNDNELGSDGPVYIDSGIQRIQDVHTTRQVAEPFCKIERADGNSNKRSRTEGDFGAKDGPSRVNDNELGSDGTDHFDGGIQRIEVVPKTRLFAEPFCMIERDDGCIQEEFRSCLFDLSKYETPVRAEKLSHLGFPTQVNVVNDDSVNLLGNRLKKCIEKPEENLKKIVAMTEIAVCQKAEIAGTTHPIDSERLSRQDKSQDKKILKSSSERVFGKDSLKLSGHVLETFPAKTAETRKNILQMPKNVKSQNGMEKSTTHLAETRKVTKTEPAEMGDMYDWKGMKCFTYTDYAAETKKVTKTEPAAMSDMHVWKSMLHGTVEKGIKEGTRTSNRPIKDEILGVVKDEPIDFDDTLLCNDPDASCLVVMERENYLELPTEFPSVVSARSRVDRRVVLIRGPDARLWPVMYNQKFGIKNLNNGWKAFSEEYGVQPGDECLFQSEYNNQECIFRFSIVNRQVNAANEV